MDMPVHIRKFWIQKYNSDNNETSYNDPNTNVINGEGINTYASLEQMKAKNAFNRG
jgi:hypothetical protein